MKKKIVDNIAQKVKEAENCIIERYKNKQISEEEDITAQLAGKIAELIDGIEEKNFKLYAKVYTRKGRNSEEKITGADMAVMLENNSIKKSFLVQSKKGVKKNGYLGIKADKKLKEQCEKMLEISSDSFVMVYTFQGIFTIPAFEIEKPNKASYKRLHTFFKEFLRCFIGDHKIVEIAKEPEGLLKLSNIVLHIKINYR